MRNKKQRIFAIGDIHGMSDKLRDLLRRLPLSPEDRVVFLGDYINRGPDSKGVLDTLLAFRQEHPNTVFLMGNHEWLLLEYARTGENDHLRLLRIGGVEATLESYDNAPVRSLSDLSFLPPEHLEFLENLQLLHRQDGYLFIHAGVPHGQQPEDCRLDTLLFLRGTFLTDPWQGEETIVFGHTPFETPFVAPHKIGIDTGAVYGNQLTAVELPPDRTGLRFHHS